MSDLFIREEFLALRRQRDQERLKRERKLSREERIRWIFGICSLVIMLCAVLLGNPDAVAADQREISNKYRHAAAVVAEWDRWQRLLYERANTLEVRPERRQDLADKERKQFTRMFASLRKLEEQQ